MIDLLRKNGNFYKANLHCHTTFSDGGMTPEEVKKWYKSHGYSIVAYTDHSKYLWHSQLQDQDFLPVAGVEAAFTCLDLNNPPLKYKLCHINFWAKDPNTAVYIPEEQTYDIGVINRYIAKMKANGFLCGLNHPSWSRQTTEEVHGIDGLDTFEVFNYGSQFIDNNGDGQGHYAVFLGSGKRAWAVATDDNHAAMDGEHQTVVADDTLGGYIMISMPDLTYSSFAESLENGRFYASTGPEFKALYIDEEKDMLVIDCSAVRLVIVKGIHTVKAARVIAKDDSITHAEIPLAAIRQKEPHFRVELVNTAGQRAYSQPYWFD